MHKQVCATIKLMEYHGFSAYENKEALEAILANHDIQNVLDVGAGEGYYGKLIGDRAKVTAIEIWQPTVRHLESLQVYANVIDGDIRNFNYDQSYDLIIFGDVLEHLHLDEAIAVWQGAMDNADIVMVSIPNGSYPQGAIHGNEAEAHLIENAEADLIPQLTTPSTTFKYPITTTYVWINK